ncbi:hypothetical protein O0L34_g17706 [Tuta absoluta]|nr:hypothetical protein O0L34_g17706 [Tuta absoluta]
MDNKIITHPHNATFPSKTYYGQIDCVHVIEAKENKVIRLTFIDVFHIEEHPKCAHDYLEIRNGQYGFSKLMGKFCGTVFPPTLTSTGPFMWLKFKSDDTIEYEGFTIKVEFISSTDSYRIPSECYMQLKDKPSGLVDITQVDPVCIQKSKEGNHGIDLLFNITTAENTDINLNFTQFDLSMPNECEENIVEVYGYIMEEDKNLDRFCGSAANALSTRPEGKPNPANRGNVMYVHIYMSQKAYEATKINATYTAFRTLDPMKDEKCDESTEFNCDDNTCIAFALKCDRHAHCRLKTDEDAELCKNVQESLIQQPHIMVILVIFSLILSGMSFVFLFKCIRKLYQDHKAIKEHIRQSTEENLDSLMGVGEQILNPGLLTRELRASLERENHANEYKRGLSRHKIPQQTSIESDFEESPLDQDDRPWRTEVGVVPEPLEKKVERNGRTRRSDVSKKEESVRKVSVEEKKEIRDAAVGAPDTKESGCQTRESLFETATAPSSDGSNSASNSRGFSTFGYSGATLARPSPPTPAPAPMISSTQIELLRQLPSLDGSYTSSKSRKKLPDRRPMSAETTRSAPDVIIVSKPIR